MADEPKGTRRDYTVLAHGEDVPVAPDGQPMWVDYGTFGATAQDGALKAATAKHPELKQEGVELVAVPPSSWQPVTREVEMVPRERFKPVGERAKQQAAAEKAKAETKAETDASS